MGRPSACDQVAGSGTLVADRHRERCLLVELVGTAGFEPATTTPPVWCATRLRYAPRFAASLGTLDEGGIILNKVRYTKTI